MMKLTGLNLLSNLIYDPYITNACAQMDLRHPNTHLLKLKTKVRDKLIYPSTSSTSNWHFMIPWPACFAAGKNQQRAYSLDKGLVDTWIWILRSHRYGGGFSLQVQMCPNLDYYALLFLLPLLVSSPSSFIWETFLDSFVRSFVGAGNVTDDGLRWEGGRARKTGGRPERREREPKSDSDSHLSSNI